MGDTANELHGKLKKADERVAYLERTLDYVLAYSGAKKPVRAAAPETAAVVESEAVADGSTNNEDSGDKENSEADGGNENTVTEGGVAAGGKAARKASRKAPVTKKKRGGSTNKGKKNEGAECVASFRFDFVSSHCRPVLAFHSTQTYTLILVITV